MVKHIILWKLKDDLSEEEKQRVKQDIKAGLEGLAGRIPGLLNIVVNVDGRLDSSNADVMLDSTFTDEAALKAYAVHPEHVAVADGKVRPFTCLRTCLDYMTND
ncbi:MAG: Dabb family protein [Bacteroidaceae bacterium]|nr:Dabb family protein [Bacteroidaceae bacterium]